MGGGGGGGGGGRSMNVGKGGCRSNLLHSSQIEIS